MQEDKNESGTLRAAINRNAREASSSELAHSDEERNARIVALADSAIDATRDLQRAGRDPNNFRPSHEEEKKRPSKKERRVARLEMAERVMRAGMSLYEQIVEAERPSSSAESKSQGANIPVEEDLDVFRDVNYHWAGGVRDPRSFSDIDMFIPQNEEHIA